MANVLVEETSLTNIANAIRNKNGTTVTYKPGEMANAINNISTSEDLSAELSQQNTLLSNQTTTIEDIQNALVDKNIILPTKTLKITENGTYDVLNYAKANVDIDTTTIEDNFVTRNIKGSYINNRVTEIGSSAFQYTDLTSVSCENVTRIGANAFYECSNLTSISFENVTHIYHHAFEECSSLTNINLPNLKEVWDYAFHNTGVETFNLPTVTHAYREAFSSDGTTKTVLLPNLIGVTSYSFANDTGCTKLDIGKITTFYGYTLYNMSALTDLIIRTPSVPTVFDDSIRLCPALTNIYVPDELIDSYKVASVWSNYASKFKPLSALEE